MSKKTGFALLKRERLLRVAASGGRQAHKLKKAHRWTVAEARDAGRKGGLVSAAKQRAAERRGE